MAVIEGTTRPYKVASAEYDFAVEGGAIGTVTLHSTPGDMNGNVVPAGSVVLGGFIEVTTAVAQAATGTLAVSLESAGDLQAAAGPGHSLGRKSVVPAFTGATSIKTTANRSVTMTIGTIVVTAGKLTVTVFYR